MAATDYSERTSCYVCGHSIEEHAGHECTECNCICFEPEPDEEDE